MVYIHTKGYFSAIKAMKSCCLQNGEGTGRHSVKWGKPSMEQQILDNFTHRPKLKGISQLSGIWSLAAEESVERSREWWKRLVNILLHQQDDNRLTIYLLYIFNVRINFELFLPQKNDEYENIYAHPDLNITQCTLLSKLHMVSIWYMQFV